MSNRQLHSGATSSLMQSPNTSLTPTISARKSRSNSSRSCATSVHYSMSWYRIDVSRECRHSPCAMWPMAFMLNAFEWISRFHAASGSVMHTILALSARGPEPLSPFH